MFRRLLTLDEAKRVIRRHFDPKPLGSEEIPLLEANNRVLAKDAVAEFNIPPFDRSTVDGYALKAEDTFGANEKKPVRLQICGTVNAGEDPGIEISQGKTVEIATGAPIPKGADAIVMVEHTQKKNHEVCIYSGVARDENIMKAGADIRTGETILKAGQVLGPREIGVLAALGEARAKVYQVPQVAVLSTGAEITEPGRELLPGKIYDINSYSLSAAVLEAGGRTTRLGTFPDDVTRVSEILKKTLTSTDLVITSGGVSVGPKDFMPQTLNSLAKPGVIVTGIAIKPGKPTTVAVIGKKLVFALPGHPASAFLVFHLIVRPIILSMAGREEGELVKLRASVSMRVFSAKGRRTFVMVHLIHQDRNCLVAEPVSTGLSGAITTVAKADGFFEISENEQFVDSGEEVEVQLFGY